MPVFPQQCFQLRTRWPLAVAFHRQRRDTFMHQLGCQLQQPRRIDQPFTGLPVDAQPIDQIAQFAHVSRPLGRAQYRQCLLIQRRVDATQLAEEVLCQQRDVTTSRARAG